MSTENKQKAIDKFNAWVQKNFGTEVKEVEKQEEPVEKKFETVLLVDGETEVTIEPAVEVGAAAVMNAEDGTPVAAPVGEYELQDGRVIVIAEEGVIAEVRNAEETEEPMAGDKPEEADKVKRIIERIESEKIFETIKGLQDEVKFLKEENETLTARFAEVEDAFSETKTFTKETFEHLYAEPSKEPVVENKNPLNKFFNKKSTNLEEWLEKTNKND